VCFCAVTDLAKDGTYAGNDVIVALSRCYGVDVVIHQLATPNWEVRAPLAPHPQPGRLVHLVYLRGEHYCSVRTLKTGQASSGHVSRLFGCGGLEGGHMAMVE